MVELKQRILTSLSKLSDQDTYQIAVEDIEKTIQSLSPDSFPMFLNLSKLLKDADSGVKDACRDSIGELSGQCLKGESGGNMVGLFVKPMFEAMICKLFNNQNFVAKATLLLVVASLSQVGAIPPQSLEALLLSIHEFLGSTDWATQKAAADTLSSLALQSSNLIVDRSTSMIAILESCRFDRMKPVIDSITEALQSWKKVAGEEEEVSVSEGKGGSITDKAVVILKKKAPALIDRELNPDFFQKLETRGSNDLLVVVVFPRRYLNSSNLKSEEESKTNDPDTKRRIDENQGEPSRNRLGFSKVDGQSEGSFISNKESWLAVQRQLVQLERQQTHLMNMLQDFMGVSHDSMVKLENRVRGLERTVEDMARDLSISSGRRGGNFLSVFEGSYNRPSGKYNLFSDYGSKFSGNGQVVSRRAPASSNRDSRSPKSELESDPFGDRRGWDKGPVLVRLGEGPSARRRAVGDDNVGPKREPIWTSWSNAMHALQVGDMDSAYAEVLTTGDDLLLIKLMDRSGPMVDQLSNEIANEALQAITDALGIPMESKKELLLNLHEAASTINPPENWEGAAPDQLLLQLASAWKNELQQFDK
ncbi:ARM repeat superfamily protein isoform 2 [Hibiscus syriacus]|uniref:ARM repeat superfamily protein isoform 2 n=1 Tax=Hibiscus syriacus TaxID=106335 RepID=A0A6A2YJC2_HIBSY|nr:ARM repeat superfamily protein isoform 2 [Hibiscus syriacus]